jgi:hypothetical protein
MHPAPTQALFIYIPALAPEWVERYHRALLRELTSTVPQMDLTALRSCYISTAGTLYDPGVLDTCGILNKITSDVVEISFSTDRQLLPEQQGMLHQEGVTRIHYTIEDINERWISFLAEVQGHTAIDVCMYLTAGWKEQFRACLSTNTQHLSLSFAEDEGEGTEIDIYDQYAWAIACLAAAGFRQYSTYDFALPGYESVQQQIYAQYGTYWGFGAGACSFDGNMRYQNVIDVAAYCNGQEENKPRYENKEHMTEKQRSFEKRMLALSTTGLRTQELAHGTVSSLITEGLMYEKEGRLFLTTRGRLMENAIITRIF